MIPQPVTVIVMDDHPIVRDGLVATLASQPQLRVVAAAANFQELVQVVQSVSADVLDILGIGGAPLTLVARLTREHPQP